ncbi:MAG: hypothetical protein AUJ97_05665 [Bacteroidetes bacterium CG2_30_32_10]|nr:MAG: hypothetical protein AUJ97_05665 [Bacteroidetes bacterium CG2_30_32_10]
MKTNKISLLLTVLLILSINLSCFAQAPKDSCRYEIGLGIPSVVGMFDAYDLSTFSSNISFKIVNHKNAFRCGISYEFFGYYYKNLTGVMINAGYERRFFNKKSILITGIDLCYYQKAYDYDKIKVEVPGSYHTFYNVGIGPVLGYIYQPTKKLSIQTECGFFYGQGEVKHYDNRDNKKLYDSYKGKYFVIHRGLSINVYYRF